MENTNTNTNTSNSSTASTSAANSETKPPTLCIAGCGFYGSEAFDSMCSQCYKAKKKESPSSSVTDTTLTTISSTPIAQSSGKVSPASHKPAKPILRRTSIDDTNVIPTIEKSRKHLRSPSPDAKVNSAPGSTVSSPAPSSSHVDPAVAASGNATPAVTPATASADNNNNNKPVQTNKGRCFKCRLKVPLAKQAANKCRCGYVFCDSHRYPDRHDCDIDYAKLDREILAKNNPKLHERPRGGRSFQRIDSL